MIIGVQFDQLPAHNLLSTLFNHDATSFDCDALKPKVYGFTMSGTSRVCDCLGNSWQP
ncbi:hypothetical protein DPMN_183430 [Dreissena polymorpha]|uniref:Uncharacterized protein n=1 Tax=Dreissena polymorpha TaxID=45954 RepID=A0A9D4DH28_DREPO|nr:hypothetical protein DPMN_183430 [Dreissena polymorpha]